VNIQDFFSNIIESMPSALITVDSKLLIKQINTNALRICAVDSDKVLNSSVMAAFPMLQNSQDEIDLALSLNAPVILDRVEYSVGELNSYYQVSCYPLAGVADFIVIQIDDTTRRELLEQRILQAEKMRSLDGLAAGIAHEVNNPLSAIINAIQSIKRRLETTRQANIDAAEQTGIALEKLEDYLQVREIKFFLDSIEEGAFRSINVVDNMLKFSSPGGSSLEACDINKLLEQSIKFIRKDYQLQNNINFETIKIESSLAQNLPEIPVLSLELQQVFINLLGNAEQAITLRRQQHNGETPYAGKISLETRLQDDSVIIVVGDNGCGMSDDVVRKIFDPYFSTRHDSGGHGLGLSTVYRIINSLLDGEIEVRSALNLGTQFSISLPIHAEHETEPQS
jgi:signal transduction histidine kinase